ncbi:uncharacterized protein [Ptychodera flava]|uniref:uncharacterized protein n=1 Tax=Ptychodera flava TaxID=63121 RepID=UPI00396A3B95
MSTNDESCGCDRSECLEEPPIAFGAGSLSDEEFQESRDDEPHAPYCDHAHGAECEDYKTGKCMEPRRCGAAHPHRVYPSDSRWKTEQIQGLRFECRPFNMDHGQSYHRLVCDWLFRVVRNNASEDSLPKLPEYPYVVESGGDEHNMPAFRTFQNHLAENLKEDDFLNLLSKFVTEHDLEMDDVKMLTKAANTSEFIEGAEKTYMHRRMLLTWIAVCGRCTRGAFHETCVDDLMAAVINSAAYEAGCLVMVKIRESTARTLLVCGQPVEVQTNIEVCNAEDNALVQVITSTESRDISMPVDVGKFLPQLVCKALAIAKGSPFGNRYYKTAYQVVIHSVCSPDCEEIQLYVFLVRCHIPHKTLGDISFCPIANPMQRSFLIHEKVPCGNIFNEAVILNVYRAIKAVLLISRGYEPRDLKLQD